MINNLTYLGESAVADGAVTFKTSVVDEAVGAGASFGNPRIVFGDNGGAKSPCKIAIFVFVLGNLKNILWAFSDSSWEKYGSIEVRKRF